MTPRRGRGLGAAAVAAALGLGACVTTAACSDRRGDPRRLGQPTAASADGSAPPAPPDPPARVIVDFLGALPTCDVGHRGLLLDGGTPALAARFGWTGAVPQGVTDVEHDGSTWARVAERKVDLLVAVPERAHIFVAARAEGHASKSAQVYLDDQPLGSLALPRQQIRVATTGATTLPVDAGLHVVSLRFSGRVKDEGSFADVDWLRVGVPDEPTAPGNPPPVAEAYGAPTLRDVVAPAAAIGGVPHKSIALRAPGFVRCPLRITKTTRVRGYLGLSGDGSADAEVRVLADGKPTQVVQTFHLEAGAKRWVELDRALADYGAGIAAVELAATRATKGTRVLFGDPRVIVPSAGASAVSPARAVVIVVLDGVERTELPPWTTAPGPQLGALSDLVLNATTFDRHRAPTTVVSAVVATLLSGLPPRVHGLGDAGARLPARVTTIAAVARDASVRTAMFTGVPTTFRAFGFGEAWEKFVEFAPSSGDPATAPIDAAAQWLVEVARAPNEPRMLAVVHARGAHPPWDVREAVNVPPTDYTGLVEPRRAAQILAKMRRRRARETLSEADRTRIRALEQIALGGQDRAIAALVAALKTANLWDGTLFIVTGDVGSGASDAWLYGDGLPLKEPLLTLPLYVHFPGGAHAGARIVEPTTMPDIARTALAALGLSFSKETLGRDLARVAAEPDAAEAGPQIATLGEGYSARWGDAVLTGRFPKPPDFCDLSVDVACAFNRRDLMPITTLAIFQRLVEADARARASGSTREPATLDNDMQAALNVWGAD